MIKQIISLLLILSSIAFPQQAGKAYILSEGGFSAGTAKLGMLDIHTGGYSSNIFTPGSPGLYPDGLIYNNGYLYMAEQGSFGAAGKVYKLDSNGTVISSKVVGTNPYSLAVSGGKIFVTNGAAGNVSVLDENTLNLITTTAVGVYPQEIIAHAGKIFVANTSLFGGAEDNTISVIDPVSGNQITKISVKKDPSSLAVSKDGYLLAACPGSGNAGAIYKIDPSTYAKIDSFFSPVEGVSKDIAVDLMSNKIYYIGYSGNIVEHDLVTRQSSALITGTPGTNYYYGYNFDYLAKKHYVLDAKSFTVSGSLNVYGASANLLNTYTTGLAPRRVVFKYDQGTTAVKEIAAIHSLVLSNYPNPFSESTRIEWRVFSGEWQVAGNDRKRITLRVYNTMGELVETLVDKPLEDGVYSEEFEGKNLPAGIYFCELVAREQRRVIKLVVKK